MQRERGVSEYRCGMCGVQNVVGELGTSARPEVTAAPTVQAAVLLSPRPAFALRIGAPFLSTGTERETEREMERVRVSES